MASLEEQYDAQIEVVTALLQKIKSARSIDEEGVQDAIAELEVVKSNIQTRFKDLCKKCERFNNIKNSFDYYKKKLEKKCENDKVIATKTRKVQRIIKDLKKLLDAARQVGNNVNGICSIEKDLAQFKDELSEIEEYIETDHYEEAYDVMNDIKDAIRASQMRCADENVLNTSVQPVQGPRQMKLDPNLIPTFTGKVEHYPTWKNAFNHFMNSARVDEEHQAYYLQNSKAIEVPDVKLALQSKSLSDCWELLERRYGSEILCSSSMVGIMLGGKSVPRVGPELSKLVTSVESCFTYLDSLKDPMVTMKVILIQHMVNGGRFPEELKTELVKAIAKMHKPDIEVLLDNLRLYQRMPASKGGAKPAVNNVNNSSTRSKGKGGAGFPNCSLGCPESHPLWKCSLFKEKSATEKLDYVQNVGRCVSCLKTGHTVETCHTEWVCDVDNCGEKHNRSLHDALVGAVPSVNLVVNCAAQGGYLSVQKIPVKKVSATVIWDSGASCSLITRKFMIDAGLKMDNTYLKIQTPGGMMMSSGMCKVPLMDRNGVERKVTAAVVQNIAHGISGCPVALCRRVFGNEKTFDDIKQRNVDVLLGVNNIDIFPREIDRGGGCILYQSNFGNGLFVLGAGNVISNSVGPCEGKPLTDIDTGWNGSADQPVVDVGREVVEGPVDQDDGSLLIQYAGADGMVKVPLWRSARYPNVVLKDDDMVFVKVGVVVQVPATAPSSGTWVFARIQGLVEDADNKVRRIKVYRFHTEDVVEVPVNLVRVSSNYNKVEC